MPTLQAIVLAAGKSKRLNTERTKLLEKLCGQEIILYITKLLTAMHIPATIVVGHQKELVIHTLSAHHNNLLFATQDEQLGTAHAVECSRGTWYADHILIMKSDIPLINKEIIDTLYQAHLKTDATISFVTSHNSDGSASSYGRVIKVDNQITIVEAKHGNEDFVEHCCINAGIYMVKREFLSTYLPMIQPHEITHERYITELVSLANKNNYTVTTTSAPFDRIRGINTFQELWAVEQVKRADLIKYWMDNGVRFTAAQNVHIDLNVTIGANTIIGCGVQLRGNTTIGKHCTIEEFTTIEDSKLESHAVIYSHSVIKNSTIQNHAHVGPFAHIRENTILEPHTHVGNFVEVKKSTVGKGSKAKHLSYVGDSTLGNNVNIGAGTITCNHNGVTKNKTTIKDNAYIGSNTILIAPVTIGEHGFTAAGSVITENVPADALAIARSKQINKLGYGKKLRTAKPSKKTKKATTSDDSSSFTFIGAIKTSNDSTLTE